MNGRDYIISYRSHDYQEQMNYIIGSRSHDYKEQIDYIMLLSRMTIMTMSCYYIYLYIIYRTPNSHVT